MNTILKRTLLLSALLIAAVIWASESFQDRSLERLQDVDYGYTECILDMTVITEYSSSSTRVDNLEDIIDSYTDLRDSLRRTIATVEDADDDDVNDDRQEVIDLVLLAESSVETCNTFASLYAQLERNDDLLASSVSQISQAISNVQVTLGH